MKKLAAEIIWNTEQTSIISFNEIDPNTLSKSYLEDGSFVWVQYANKPDLKRILTRHQILTNF